MAKKLSLVKHMQIALKLLVFFWSRANLIYRIYSIKRRPRINAASSCGVYSNNRLKKHMVIIASIAVEILSEPGTNPFECTSSDVEKAYPT